MTRKRGTEAPHQREKKHYKEKHPFGSHTTQNPQFLV